MLAQARPYSNKHTLKKHPLLRNAFDLLFFLGPRLKRG